MKPRTTPRKETPPRLETMTKSQMLSSFTKSLRSNGVEARLSFSKIKMDRAGLIAFLRTLEQMNNDKFYIFKLGCRGFGVLGL